MSRGSSRPTTLGRLLNGGVPPGYESVPAQTQNVKKGKVYVFGDADVQEDEVVEFEMSDVRSRKASKPSTVKENGPLFIERKIGEDDTLQSLSLQYGCPVSEIKRVNNLIKDQEFYALKKLKIPVKKHSFLVDRLDSERETVIDDTEPKSYTAAACFNGLDESGPDSDAGSGCNLSDPETQKLLIRTLSINDAVRSQSKEAQDFLHNMDKDLSQLRNSTRVERNSLNEVISVLTNKSVSPLVRKPPEHLNGADCGIRWRTIVIALLVIAVLLPTVYILYYFYQSGKFS